MKQLYILFYILLLVVNQTYMDHFSDHFDEGIRFVFFKCFDSKGFFCFLSYLVFSAADRPHEDLPVCRHSAKEETRSEKHLNRTKFILKSNSICLSPCIYFAILTFLMSMHRSF
jgi:hypothetical protein